MKVKVKKLDPSVETPRYAHKGDACFDLAILIDNNKNKPMYCRGGKFDSLTPGLEPLCVNSPDKIHFFDIGPAQSIVFHTGLAFEVAEGYVLKIHARSSTGIKNRLMLSNTTGIIDSSYRGEVRIALTNTSNEPVRVYDRQRVAQGAIEEVLEVEFEEVEELSTTERGTGGIGSTGK